MLIKRVLKSVKNDMLIKRVLQSVKNDVKNGCRSVDMLIKRG